MDEITIPAFATLFTLLASCIPIKDFTHRMEATHATPQWGAPLEYNPSVALHYYATRKHWTMVMLDQAHNRVCVIGEGSTIAAKGGF